MSAAPLGVVVPPESTAAPLGTDLPAQSPPLRPVARRAAPSRQSEIELFSLAGRDGYLHEVNSAFERLLGVPPGGTEGRSLLEFVHPEDLPHVVEAFALLDGGAEEVLLDNRFLLENRSVVHLQWVVRPLEGSELWWAAGRDITEFRHAVADAGDLRARLDLAVGPSLAAMWDLDPWARMMTWEPEAGGVLGLAPDEVPATTADLLALVHPHDRAAVAEAVEGLRGDVATVEVDFRTGDDPAPRHLRLRGKTVERDRRGRGRRAIGLILDVSAEKALQEQMLTLVMSDALTGVPNRRAFDGALRTELRRCTRAGEPLSVAMVDIDDFKRFNDTFGHLVGDDVLCTVSRALSGSLGPGPGLIARFGGEEFAAVLPGVDAPEAAAVAESLVLAVRGTRLRQAPDWPLTVSVGSATWAPGSPPCKAAELLNRADQALYAAKGAGKNRAVSHDGVPRSATR